MMIGAVVLVVWLVRVTTGASSPSGRAADVGAGAHDVLARRYAAGEMATQEYRERRDDLEGTDRS